MALSIGLGKNSPLPIETDPAKYEGLIIRHGQWVRWSVASKCTCLLSSNRPDARCNYCHGSGWRYRFQTEEDELQVQGSIVDQETVEIPASFSGSRVLSVFLPDGKALRIASVFGRWIKIAGTSLQVKGTAFVNLSVSRVKTVPPDSAIYAGYGIVKLSAYESESPWTTIPFDLVSLSGVKRANGTPLTVLSWSVDKIAIDTTIVEPEIGESLVINAEYMPPYKMAVVNQNLSYNDRMSLQEIGGDSIVIHPFAYRVGEYDTITLWAGTQIRKKVIKRGPEYTDLLPDLFVSDVLSVTTKDRVYREGVDFVLWDRNSVRWLLSESERPAEDSYFSIEYMANLTYRVIQQMPNVRSSENKRFPSRVAVKLMTGTSGTDQV